MSSIIISKELSNSNISHPEGYIVDFGNFEECITLLSKIKNKSVSFYDLTVNQDLSHEEIIPVNDQINCTGKNPLVGQQSKLGIDFVDMTTVYESKKDGIVTHSCGNFLKLKFDFPSHYLAHIVILARVLNFETISGWLVNNNKDC
ncbi:MAG: hypothetical protein H8E72_07935 [Candidatus Marinimicrobia bacterium]|nr:hypothetical protein [Candidatus Neomarinimicrobiota bacterium]